MMASGTVRESFICHFCFNKFPDYTSLISHFSDCHSKPSPKRNDETLRIPRLNQTDRDILQILKLHRLNDKSTPPKPKDTTNSYLQIPLSMKYIHASKQSSFDDSICHTNHSLLTNVDQIEQENFSNILNTKSYHIYKYSRREQKLFYASVKRARLKKQCTSSKRTRQNSLIFPQKNFLINLPTKIASRQRLNLNSNNSYPLIFDSNFHSLVQNSTNDLLENYFSQINSYFHLINSIASQEFQTIVHSNDNQHHVFYTAFSFLHILRQTMADYSISLQQTLKRNYFQSFQYHNQQVRTPCKIPRYDQSISSSSHIQIGDNHQQHLRTPTDRILPPTTTISNFIPVERDQSVIHPVQSDITFIDHEQPTVRASTDSIITSFIPIIEEQNTNKNPSPIFLKKQKIEPIENDQPIYPIERAGIRLINGLNQNKKSSSSRQRPSKPTNQIDENSLIKPIRMSTRRNTIKTEVITDLPPSFETKPVILSSNQISHEWLTHTVFYRCHACSHEEFFVVLSRECMNLHISSHHSNMEENFKQHLSSFLTNKGRSLKLFQHYLKWQQPWSEKQIEQIFKLSNK